MSAAPAPQSGVRMALGPTILLHGGTYFDLLAPRSSEFTIRDVAHGLAMCCRFVGQCARFYSVAEHSVFVSLLVPDEDALAGLLHDASEAFLGDVSKPLKTLLPDYRAIEDRVQRAVFERFGLPWPMPKSVKQADLAMLAAEQRQAMGNERDVWTSLAGVEPAPVALEFRPPAQAEKLFLARFKALLRERVGSCVRNPEDA